MLSDQSLKLKDFIHSLPHKSLVTLDHGNSHPHQASFESGELTAVIPALRQQATNSNIVSSSVTTKEQNSFNLLWQDKTFAGMPVHYSRQLGTDRLYQAALLYQLYSQEPIVLIDAGTFITIDLIDQKGFRGGHIYPGIKTFLSSYTKGDKLPALTIDDYKKHHIDDYPRQTNEAILDATKNYLMGILSSSSIRNHKVILTGGEADLIRPLLNDNCDVITHLIHYALYYLDSLKERQ
jgi:type III pantothenate kinase